MPHIHQQRHRAHVHKIKRLHHPSRHDDQHMSHYPSSLFDESLLDKTVNYIKFFDYPLSQLLSDHSTDPLQNTTRQYINSSATNSSKGRFVNHEMIIRRNGETTFLRPKQDFVLANGFTPVIRPSSNLPSYQSIISQSQVSSSSLSIMKKMSTTKPSEQTVIIKTKRKHRHRAKRCHEKFIEHKNLQNYNFSNEFNHHTSQESSMVHFFQEALHEMIEEKNYPLPPPLMSILPQFHGSPSNYYDQSFPLPRLDRNLSQSPSFNEQQFLPPLTLMSNTGYEESSYNLPLEQYHQLPFSFPQHEHVCIKSLMSLDRDYTRSSGYFF